jgi:hypothetical protein
MCGEQWNEDVCASCGWYEGKQPRYSSRALDAVADVVLRYRPKPKSEPAKQRRKKRRKLEKEK